jgi:hypothetical protein
LRKVPILKIKMGTFLKINCGKRRSRPGGAEGGLRQRQVVEHLGDQGGDW